MEFPDTSVIQSNQQRIVSVNNQRLHDLSRSDTNIHAKFMNGTTSNGGVVHPHLFPGATRLLTDFHDFSYATPNGVPAIFHQHGMQNATEESMENGTLGELPRFDQRSSHTTRRPMTENKPRQGIQGGMADRMTKSLSNIAGEQRRESRLAKNRQAAKECRRKKKEYVKCLENRVRILESQQKSLIEELKQMKQLYCNS